MCRDYISEEIVNNFMRSLISSKGWKILVGGSASVIILMLFLDYFPTGQAEAILRTLVVAQAAIFAIVFSVIILGVRLSATKYSHRAAEIFRQTPEYQGAVAIFAISIIMSLVGMFLMNGLGDTGMTIVIITCSALAVAALWNLYLYVDEILKKTTPEGILTEIRNYLTPEEIRYRAELASEDPTERDPFLIITTVINSAIVHGDRASAQLGLDILREQTCDFLRGASIEEFEKETPVEQSFRDLCESKLLNTALEARNADLADTAVEVTDVTKQIGETAAEEGFNEVVESSAAGQAYLVDELEFDEEDERIRREAVDSSKMILKSGAENELWGGTANGIRRLGWLSAASVMRRDATQRSQRSYDSLLILLFPKIISKPIDSDEELENHSYHDWMTGHTIDGISPAEHLIAACYGSMAELTSAVIRYEIRTEKPIVRWQSVSSGWRSGRESLEDSGLTEIHDLWLGTMLYLDYIKIQSDSKIMDGYTAHTVQVNKEDANRVIEKILNGSLDPTARIDHTPGGVNPIKMPLTGTPVPPLRDVDVTFVDWLKEKKGLIGRTNRMGSVRGLDREHQSDENGNFEEE